MSRSSDRFTADARPEFLKRPRPTEIKSLTVGAAKSLENGELAGGFDAFGDDRRAKTGGHRLEAGNDDFGAFVEPIWRNQTKEMNRLEISASSFGSLRTAIAAATSKGGRRTRSENANAYWSSQQKMATIMAVVPILLKMSRSTT